MDLSWISNLEVFSPRVMTLKGQIPKFSAVCPDGRRVQLLKGFCVRRLTVLMMKALHMLSNLLKQVKDIETAGIEKYGRLLTEAQGFIVHEFRYRSLKTLVESGANAQSNQR